MTAFARGGLAGPVDIGGGRHLYLERARVAPGPHP
jgi:hypothetical protein